VPPKTKPNQTKQKMGVFLGKIGVQTFRLTYQGKNIIGLKKYSTKLPRV
jgi:hypothetical protein